MSVNNPKKTGLKFISIIMSVLLWFYIVNQGSLGIGRSLIDTDLRYINVPENLTVTGPERVAVKLWGAFSETGDITAYVDLAGLPKGLHKVSVNIQPVTGAMFTTVQPDKVEIRLEDLREHVVAVKSEVKSNPPAGYAVRQMVISPSSCMVRGKLEAVNQVVAVVASADLSKIKDAASFKVKLQARDARGKNIANGITLVPETVDIYAVVEKQSSLKKLIIKSQLTGVVAEGYRMGDIKIDPAEVSALGDLTRVDALTQILTKPIDVKDKKESFSQEVELIQPEGVVINPQHVNISIKIDKIIEKEGQQ